MNIVNIFDFRFENKNQKSKIRNILVLSLFLFTLYSLPISAEILDVQVSWDVEDEPLNIGDIIHFRVVTDGPGSVIVDISTVHQSIQLYDDGTNGDTLINDHAYELDYSIFEDDTVEEGPILVHFVADDGTAEKTGPDDDITPHITIDGTRPVVTNDGVSPDPFNPEVQVAYIRYILTENASVLIQVYNDQNQLIRTLGTPSGRPGENHTTWDGTDDDGNLMVDGIYTYVICATDNAGNEAISTRGGCILSTVYIEIDNSLIAPNPFTPDNDGVNDITWITFDIKLVATEEQLRILGFGSENLITASTEDDDMICPYGLVGITVFDSSGESKKVFSHDLSPEADNDYAPNGWPNGKRPMDVPPGSMNFLGDPNGMADFTDEKKSNDWDTLMPLNGPDSSDEGPCYTANFSVGWDAKNTPDGTYLISIECELTGRTWEFGDYMKGEGGILLGEKWHAIPARHHGITAFPRRKSVIIDRKEVTPVDDDPPIVSSTSPSGGSIIDPTREQIKEIIVNLDDGAGGSGVDPIQSSVALLDPLNNKLGGQIVPFGINTVKLVLDLEVAISGEYTIVVIPVDKRGNKAKQASLYNFVVEDTSAPTVVPNTIKPKPTDFDDEGKPIEPYIQPISEISVVLTDGLTGSGVDLDNSTMYLRNAQDETVDGELIRDPENRKLNYVFDEPVAVSGTYTIVVIATDHAGAKGIYTFQFVVDMAENIAVRHEGKIYLMIYASTGVLQYAPTADAGEIIDFAGFLEGISVQKSDEFPPMVSELSPVSTGMEHHDPTAIMFDPYNIELSQEADLTLYYDEEQLPLGIKETELSVYAFKAQAKDWVQLPNVVLMDEDNELTAKISLIDQYYVIAYTSPVAPSTVEEISLDPPKHFNPDTESLTFTFARNMTDYQVEIYNVGGDRIATLKEQGRADKSLGWDGTNEDDEKVKNGIFICRISYNIDGRGKSLNRLIAVIR